MFIPPDNCLRNLRYEALASGKIVLVTAYAIRRGFLLVDPKVVKSEEQRQLASYLDGMEEASCSTTQISLTQMLRMNLNILILWLRGPAR
jgi:5-formyltetrahydrofolate cyclo-ligase